MSDASNICLACGICCDGTLIGFVELDKEELPRLRNILSFEEADDKGFILEPCKSYCNGCSIYNDRPKQCASFECGLLQSVENKSVSFDDAVESIREAKSIKQDIEHKITLLPFSLAAPSFHFKMVELHQRLKQNEEKSSLSNLEGYLLLHLRKLDALFTEKFGVSLY